MGEVQYITYPNGKELEGAFDDLDRIERQVAESAKNLNVNNPSQVGLVNWAKSLFINPETSSSIIKTKINYKTKNKTIC
ncbi:MAG: hypothetical protein IPJ32_00105 [Sphingobacteriaceae bacterium]|nr:hypothetical protein [Sphingobacteriaceae bacterium]